MLEAQELVRQQEEYEREQVRLERMREEKARLAAEEAARKQVRWIWCVEFVLIQTLRANITAYV